MVYWLNHRLKCPEVVILASFLWGNLIKQSTLNWLGIPRIECCFYWYLPITYSSTSLSYDHFSSSVCPSLFSVKLVHSIFRTCPEKHARHIVWPAFHLICLTPRAGFTPGESFCLNTGLTLSGLGSPSGQVHSQSVPSSGASGPRNCSNPLITTSGEPQQFVC